LGKRRKKEKEREREREKEENKQLENECSKLTRRLTLVPAFKKEFAAGGPHLTRVELLWQNGGKEKKEAKEFNLFS
jgi:hypothetical protein